MGKMVRKIFITLFFILSCAGSKVAVSADLMVAEDQVVGPGYAIIIYGEIEKDDVKEYISIINSRNTFPELLKITSPGGDVVTAIKIGRLVRMGHTKVWPVSSCNSSCALIVFGSSENLQEGYIGLHRPYYDEDYFSELGRSEAKVQYRKLEEYLRAYTKEMDVPDVVATKMFAVSSGEIYKMSMKQYRELAGDYPPAYHEWLKAKCGMMKKSEREDLEKVFALKNYTRYQSWKDSELKRDLIKENELLARKGMKLPEGYRNYLLEKNREFSECKNNEIEKDRQQSMSATLYDLPDSEPEFLLSD